IRPGASDLILDDLRGLGLDGDGDPIIQSRRLPMYEDALRRLRERELVYPCTCTRADVAQAASAPHLAHEGPPYPGTCAHRRSADAENLSGPPIAQPFRVPKPPS